MTGHDGSPVYVALLGSTTSSVAEKIPFARQEHAEALTQQWAEDRDRPAVVEVWPRERWQQHGPGVLLAIRQAVPARVRILALGPRAWSPDGRELETWLSRSERWSFAWDFERDRYTNQPGVARVEHRPGSSALTEASARGTDEIAVRTAMAKACVEAQRICGESPYRDLWEAARRR
ncbi:hypothetical protein [Streptomyces sp. NRRL S-350]|uniref:hypothetical protein n=1 Tax=Streptomyces sp. NRRL S-350 TaxID=1463902 RepID=UPI0004BFC644|nr:hypothetical protein [Streptomyces sp. NRRL S-350]